MLHRMKSVQIQAVKHPSGNFRWASARVKYRVALVDLELPHRQRRYKGFLATLWEAEDFACFEYSGEKRGGKYGYRAQELKAFEVALEQAKALKLPISMRDTKAQRSEGFRIVPAQELKQELKSSTS